MPTINDNLISRNFMHARLEHNNNNCSGTLISGGAAGADRFVELITSSAFSKRNCSRAAIELYIEINRGCVCTLVEPLSELEGLLVGRAAVVDLVEIQTGVGCRPVLDRYGQPLDEERGAPGRCIELSAQRQPEN